MMIVERSKLYQRQGKFAWKWWYVLVGDMRHECGTLAEVREIAKRRYGLKPTDLTFVDHA
jgi:hypothetical protein